MDYKQFKAQFQNLSIEDLSSDMLRHITQYFKASFGMCTVVWFPLIMVVSTFVYLILSAVIKAGIPALTIIIGIFLFCVVFLLLAYLIKDLSKTYLLRRAIRNKEYCIVNGQVKDVDIDRLATFDVEVNNGDNQIVDFSFNTFDYQPVLSKKLKSNEWPMVKLVCTDYGIFTFFNDGEMCTMLSTE